MKHEIKSMRPFIGAKNFEVSRGFYRDLGFEEVALSESMSVFKSAQIAFYLQNAYVKDWIDNTMIFLEVDDVNRYYAELLRLDLAAKYENVRLYRSGKKPGEGNAFCSILQGSYGISGSLNRDSISNPFQINFISGKIKSLYLNDLFIH